MIVALKLKLALAAASLAASLTAPLIIPLLQSGSPAAGATAYADWLSRKTGAQFRLPTDEEWAYAAGSRFRDEGWPDFETDDPARRWLARYEAESERSAPKRCSLLATSGQ